MAGTTGSDTWKDTTWLYSKAAETWCENITRGRTDPHRFIQTVRSSAAAAVHRAAFHAIVYLNKVGIKSAALTPKVKPQLLTAGDTFKNDNCEWNFYFWCCECPTFGLDTGKGGGGMIHVSRALKMCTPLAEEFVCSDKLTLSVSPHCHSVAYTMGSSGGNTDATCDWRQSMWQFLFCLFFWGWGGERGWGGGWGGSIFLNLNFQVEEAGRNRN